MKHSPGITAIIRILKKQYPSARIALRFGDPLELLVSTILSAQCTDKKVNEVTQGLFKKYKSVQDYAHADVAEFEKCVHSTGFYRAKTRNIIAAAQMIIRDFKGVVPDTMEELVKLPGVARKTANIVLLNAFNKIEGIAVDTHVGRLSQRLGVTKNTDPVKIERDLMRSVPRKDWGMFSYFLIEHGRAVCNAKKPLCLQCVLGQLCPSREIFYPRGAGE